MGSVGGGEDGGRGASVNQLRNSMLRGSVRGDRCLEAFTLFDGGFKPGVVSRRLCVSEATARLWWLKWRVEVLEREVERLKGEQGRGTDATREAR